MKTIYKTAMFFFWLGCVMVWVMVMVSPILVVEHISKNNGNFPEFPNLKEFV
jgi:hypothetical protein